MLIYICIYLYMYGPEHVGELVHAAAEEVESAEDQRLAEVELICIYIYI